MAQAVSQREFLVRGFFSDTTGPYTVAVPMETKVTAFTPEQAVAVAEEWMPWLKLAKVAQ